MASPFSVLRRNQSVVMAALVGVAIISFVVAPALQWVMNSARNSGSGSGIGTLVRWRGGSIDDQNYDRMNKIAYRCQNVLRAIESEVSKAGGIPKVPNYSMDSATGRGGLSFYEPGPQVIERKLLAEKAKEIGIRLDDEAVDVYLRSLTDGRVSNSRLIQLMKENDRLSKFELYEFIKEELLANLMERTAVAGLNSGTSTLVTPNRYWQFFLQFNQRVKIEAFPVLVDDLIPQVTSDPSESDLESVYKIGTNIPSMKYSPTPGFLRRYQADVEFVSGSIDNFLTPEKAKITEEEVLKLYQQRLTEGRYQVPATPEKPQEGANPVTPPDDGTPPSTGTTTSSAAPAEGEKTPANIEKTEATPAAAPTTPGTPAPSAPLKDQSSNRTESDVRLVSFIQDPATVVPAVPAVQNAQNPVVIPGSDAPAATTLPAATTVPGATTVPSATTVPAQSAEVGSLPTAEPTAPVTQTNAQSDPSTLKPGMRIQTLDEVRDSIIRELAFPAAAAKMRESLSKIGEAMQSYQQDLAIYQQSQQTKDSTIEKPSKVDLQKLADELGLQYGKTGMVDSESVQSLPIGRSRIQMQYPFGDLVLNARFPLYQQGSSLDFDFSSTARTDYVFWKVEAKDPFMPPLADIKDEVKAAWKRLEAQKLAEKKASEIAKKIEQVQEQPWDAVIPQTERSLVTSPPPFAAMTPAFGRGTPQPSQVDQIDSAGQIFLDKVFALQVGQVAVAPNQPQTTYYVVRLVEKTPTESELRSQFEKMPVQPDTRYLGFRDMQPMFNEWIDSIESDLQVEWVVPKNALMQRN